MSQHSLPTGYQILPHAADVRVRARGETLEDLFRNALRGMSAVMEPETLETSPGFSRNIVVTAPNTPTLLIDFLSEALALAHINREVYPDVDFQELSSTKVRATLRGVRVPEFAEDIKAVTYHGAEVTSSDRGHEATVMYDI